jgi:predicted  nucleic acid-binding Zn-ribbon protein
VTNLEPLLDLQERDLALDRLRHRRATLPERPAVVDATALVAALTGEVDDVRARRDLIASDERRLDDEAQGISSQATSAEKRLYSGEISSPKELQALQADVESLRRHQRAVEDRQLAAMERREPLDARLVELEAGRGSAEAELAAAGDALAAAEAAVDAEVATETVARAEVAAPISDELLSTYERCREKGNGVGAARLVGGTCQGCHLSVPSTEIDAIRHAPADQVSYCDNCGCILVLAS